MQGLMQGLMPCLSNFKKNPMDTIASDVIRICSSPSLETSTSNYATDANDWHARKSSLSFWGPFKSRILF
jgi:hypothetical protein